MKWEVLDLETYNENLKFVPYCISFSYSLKFITFYYDPKELILLKFLNFIAKQEELEFIFYIHNLNFDGFIFIEFLSLKLIKYEIFCDKTNLYYLKIFYLKKLIILKCSFKILPISLEKIGEFYGVEKINFPYDFVNSNNLNYIGPTPSSEYWKNGIAPTLDSFDLKLYTITYCENDIKILYVFLKAFTEKLTNSEIKLFKQVYSLPSYSFKFFFKFFNKKNIEENLSLVVDDFIRKSYFGGRCEIFGNKNENEYIKYYDFSGMYAQCMEEKFHIGLGKFSGTASIQDIGFHTIEYECYDINIPILPSKNLNNKLMFCNYKKNVGTYWYEEIRLFEKYGGKITKIINSYIYEKDDYCFLEYVNYCKNIRKEGKERNFLGKLLINSFYGGMGLKQNFTETYLTLSEDEFNEVKEIFDVEKFYKINSTYIILIIDNFKYKKFFKKKTSKMSLRNVSYASAIASKARIKLYKAFLEVIADGGRILYCDTDSIFAAYHNNNLSYDFGDKKWIKFYKDGVFCLPKTYSILDFNGKQEIKMKGLSTSFINFKSFSDAFYNSKTISFEKQFSLNKKNFYLERTYLTKNINFGIYDKRIFDINKKNTAPYWNPAIYEY